MSSTSAKVGQVLAKILRIKLDDPQEYQEDILRGESVLSMDTAETFVEEQPTISEWAAQYTPTAKGTVNYFKSLFPFINWIGHYNTQWLIGDLVAGMAFRFTACFAARD
jgi:solute carrier family 26 (sodium-independent sulfate anion transporter), member 11